MITPLISVNNNKNRPYVVLSKTILITKYSDYKLVHYFIYKQFNLFLKEFKIDNLEDYNLVLKYKKVYFDITQVKTK